MSARIQKITWKYGPTRCRCSKILPVVYREGSPDYRCDCGTAWTWIQIFIDGTRCYGWWPIS